MRNSTMMFAALAVLLAGNAFAQATPAQGVSTPGSTSAGPSGGKIKLPGNTWMDSLTERTVGSGAGASTPEVPAVGDSRRAYKDPKGELLRLMKTLDTLQQEVDSLMAASAVKGLPQDAARYLRKLALQRSAKIDAIEDEIAELRAQLQGQHGNGSGCKGDKCGGQDGKEPSSGGGVKPPSTQSSK